MKTQFNERNISMVIEMYELTMTNGYFNQGMGNTLVVFDVFYRNNPDNAGFAIFAGLEQVIEYIKNLHDDFSEKQAEFENQLTELNETIKQLESQKGELDSKIAEYEEKLSEDTGKHSKDEVDIVLL